MRYKIPSSTQNFLSNLMEQKIKSHPNDWKIYFKSEYGRKFYNLTEQDAVAEKARAEQEKIKKDLEEFERQQEMQRMAAEEELMMKQAQTNLDKSTKGQIGIGKGRSAGGFGAGAPGKSDELKEPGIGEILMGDSSDAGIMVPILALGGKAAQMVGDIGLSKLVQNVTAKTGLGGLKGYNIVRDPQTRKDVFIDTKTGKKYRTFSELPFKDQASYKAGQEFLGIGQALGQSISDIGGYDYLVGTIGEMGRKHIKDVLGGAGHVTLYLPNRPRDPNDYFRATAIAQQEP